MAPKGNQHAKGKGRPPTVFSDKEVETIGQELVDFLKQRLRDKDPVIHMTEFWSLHKDMHFDDWDLLQKRICFFPYYKQALQLMTLSTQMNKDLATSYGNRFLGLYSAELRQFERDVKKEEIQDEVDIKVKAGVSVTETDQSMNYAIVKGISELQRVFKKDEIA